MTKNNDHRLRQAEQRQFAEEAIIGHLILWPDSGREITSNLIEENFVNPKNLEVFQFMCDRVKAGKSWDSVMVCDKFVKWDNVSDEVNRLMDMGSLLSEDFVTILKTKTVARKMYEQAMKSSDIDLDAIGKLIKEFNRSSNHVRVISIKDTRDKAIEIFKSDDDPIVTPIHYDQLNVDIGGLPPGHVIVIGGRPSNGKSIFILNLLIMPLSQGKKVVFVDFELLPHELYWRFASIIFDIPLSWYFKKRTADGKQKLNEMQKAQAAQALLDVYDIIGDNLILAKNLSGSAIESLIEKHNPVAVVIDTINAYTTDKGRKRNENDTSVMADATRELKMMAETYETCVIESSQLNLRNDEILPDMGHLKSSAGLEENASIVLCIRNKGRAFEKMHKDGKIDYEEMIKAKGIWECGIRKNRNGVQKVSNMRITESTGKIMEYTRTPSVEETADKLPEI